ncbi:5-methylcytosine-specific restriction enzyme MRR [Halalkalibacter wakoensis JCM 9140]|uniref:5-methylcytosine-specific restriction enzyme MRR n=1 Tax=Halalkalibacter wakoensis JCM 9140 TaxID=1236970 RepID=W4Q8U1_9BACI|nr:restriction endonuclease [Halalkalibacter wakoensis]GAE28392.1 5-methylcytosine-specific restriction enzyme MRR [Halalkalibacter wakoensis JCM 9140]
MDTQTIIVFAAIAITLGSIFHSLRLKSKHNDFADLLLDQIEQDLELRKTLAMGLYLRFAKGVDRNIPHGQSFIKEEPDQFEHFVADIIEAKFGGDMFVSKASGDYGVNFENRREEGLYLGQALCTAEDVTYESVALIHSNMNKWGAVGGYVITTAGFTEKAINYADGLGIELINGVELVTMWLETFEEDTAYLKNLSPSDI